MLVAISNTPRPYAWGSRTALPELLGLEPNGEPQAELWLGAHPGSPSVIIDPTQTGGAATLPRWIAAEPQTTLGPYAHTGRLPFLLKILAAAAPLSLQAHPTPEQAALGFARENAAGVPIDSAQRNYKDACAKPELIYALSPTFDALCGFRPLEQTLALVATLIEIDALREYPQPQPLEDLADMLARPDGLRAAVEFIISRQTGVATLVSLVTTLAESSALPALEIVTALAAEYPGDPGIVISLLVNGVRLVAGEALYLPAGNIHAYLDGLGVELMNASDNVLRGGFSPKHIDVPELLSVLDFAPVPVPYIRASTPTAGLEIFEPDDADFTLVRVHGSAIAASFVITGPAIAICTSGAVSITGAEGTATVSRGESIFITPAEGELRFAGGGTMFLATTASPAASNTAGVHR